MTSLNVFSSADSENETEDVGTVLSTDSTTVTENTTEVQLDTADSNLTDAFVASTEDASEGDLVWSSYVQANDQFLPVYYQSANEDHSWLNTSEDAYATISSDGETLTIHNPDALLDEGAVSGTLDVTTVGDEKLGIGNAQSMLTDSFGMSTVDALTTAFGAMDWDFSDPQFVSDALAA
jgi:hypothetical protein